MSRFQLADMVTELEAADLLTLRAAWKLDQGTMTDQDAAMAKVFASETLGRITDRALQIHGGMGLMERAADRAVLARRAGRAHLGRHERDPAAHHRVARCCARWAPEWTCLTPRGCNAC